MLPTGKVLKGRYKIIQDLSEGGFGDTYLAKDTQKPSQPICVVKHLQPKQSGPGVLQLAKDLFDREAKVLERLGKHDQIPELLAHFDERGEFYLVQEFVDGDDLSKEIISGKKWSESNAINLLVGILEVLDFVHQQNVIHRDIKPANIIRRKLDGKIVLIDFGAVKEVNTILATPQGNTTFSTVIGTPGYMPSEQGKGKPKLASDVYAVGMVVIQALTGVNPDQLPEDPNTGEVIWRNKVNMTNQDLGNILDKMVRDYFPLRYQSAMEILVAIEQANLIPAKFPNTRPILLKQPVNTQINKKVVPVHSRSPIPPTQSSPAPNRKQRKFFQILVSLGLGLTSMFLWNFLTSVKNLEPLTKSTPSPNNQPSQPKNNPGNKNTITMNDRLPQNSQKKEAIIYYDQGIAKSDLKDYKGAITDFNKAIQIDPNYTLAYNSRGKAKSELKDYKGAIADFNKAIQLDPNFAHPYYGRGVAKSYLKDYEGAIIDHNKAIQLDLNYARPYNGRGFVKNELKDYEGAIADFNKAIQLDPNYDEPYGNRGVAKSDLKDYEGAITDFNKAIQLDPNYSYSYNGRGQAKYYLKDYEGAIADYDKAIQLDPNNAMAYSNRGAAKYYLKDYEGAIADYNKAIQLDPNYATPYSNRGIIKYELKDYEGAITDYNKAIQLDPNYAMAYNNRGLGKYYLKDYEGAIADFNKSIQLDPNYAMAYHNRGGVKDELKDYEGAIADYNKSIQLDPNYANAYNNRGLVKEKLKDYEGAIADFNKGIQLDPNNANAYSNRGSAKYYLKDYEGAREDYKRAAELFEKKGDQDSYQIVIDNLNRL